MREYTLELSLLQTPLCLLDMLVVLRNTGRIARTLVFDYAVVVQEDSRVK